MNGHLRRRRSLHHPGSARASKIVGIHHSATNALAPSGECEDLTLVGFCKEPSGECKDLTFVGPCKEPQTETFRNGATSQLQMLTPDRARKAEASPVVFCALW